LFTSLILYATFRKEIGYDGWRLDFVRGFWGGYVRDYIEASEPYFSVGEYWDSLSYTNGEADHNRDAHRQRIVDWINATNGTSGAFDVTTKGILHAVSINSGTSFSQHLFKFAFSIEQGQMDFEIKLVSFI